MMAEHITRMMAERTNGMVLILKCSVFVSRLPMKPAMEIAREWWRTSCSTFWKPQKIYHSSLYGATMLNVPLSVIIHTPRADHPKRVA
jgi:hypothetical protein